MNMIMLQRDNKPVRSSRSSAVEAHHEVGRSYNCAQLSLAIRPSVIHGDGVFTTVDYVGVGEEGAARRTVGYLFGKIVTAARRNELQTGQGPPPADEDEIDYMNSSQANVENSIDLIETLGDEYVMLTSRQCPMSYLNSCEGVNEAKCAWAPVRLDLPDLRLDSPHAMDYRQFAVTMDASVSVLINTELVFSYSLSTNAVNMDDGDLDDDQKARTTRRRVQRSKHADESSQSRPRVKIEQDVISESDKAEHHMNVMTSIANASVPDFVCRPLTSGWTPDRCMGSHGYAHILATDLSRSFIAGIDVDEVRQVRPEDASKISANVSQYELMNSPVMIARQPKWQELIKQACESAGLHFDFTSSRPSHHLVAPILLASMPGDGQQDVHWDSRWGMEQKQRYENDERRPRYSVILIFSDGRSSSFPIWRMNGIATTSCDVDEPEVAAAAAKHMDERSFLLQPSWYHTCDVKRGDILIFDHRVPHHGVENKTDQERIVLFDVISSISYKDDPKQASYQYNPHQYIGEACGLGSPKHLLALMQCAGSDPLARFDKRDKEIIRKGIDKGLILLMQMHNLNSEQLNKKMTTLTNQLSK